MIVAVSNQKGGVGKTASAVTLAALAARDGLSALIVDLDSQGNVADSLGMQPGHEIVELLRQDERASDVMVKARDHLWVIRSDKRTAGLKNELAGATMREFVLRNVIDQVDGRFDWIVLDCAPSVDLLKIAAFAAADYVLVPTKLDQLAVKGVREELATLADLRRLGVSSATLLGVLPTFFERSTAETMGQLGALTNAFREYILPPIPEDTKMREATRAGQTILEYAPGCRALVGVDLGAGKMVGGYEAVYARLSKATR